MNKRKIINDPVFGFINLPTGFLYEVYQHPYLHRLTRIKQLGMSSFVYPGAQHTRFLHTTGAMYLMMEAVQHLKNKGHQITTEEAEGVIAAILLLLSTMIALSMKDKGKQVKRSRLYYHKKYNKFYMLEIFYGARKQIFLTFAPYALILFYGADTSVIAMLLAVCAVFGMLLSPAIGALVDKLGYKKIMVADTLILVVVCILYGYAHRLFPMHIAFIVVCVNFVLDSIISLASMATNVYVRDLSTSREELTATLTTGISVNHLISVMIALLGGYIWKTLGIEVLFTLSAVLGVINSIFAATIKKPEQRTLY